MNTISQEPPFTYELFRRGGPPRNDLIPLAREQEADLYKPLDDRVTIWNANYPKHWKKHRRRATMWVRGMRLMYIARNYILDGALPIALGLLALTAILGHINLHWLQNYLPDFKALTSQTLNSD
jgi:hypothetical protein